MTKLHPLRGMPLWRLEALVEDATAAAAHGRRRTRALWDGYQSGELRGDDLRTALRVAWLESFFPNSLLCQEQWREMFNLVGYTRNGRRAQRPPEIPLLYRVVGTSRLARQMSIKHTRGEIRRPEYGWSWLSHYEPKLYDRVTQSLHKAGVFIAHVPPAALLAEIIPGEYVVDTAYPGVVIEPWQPDGDDAA